MEPPVETNILITPWQPECIAPWQTEDLLPIITDYETGLSPTTLLTLAYDLQNLPPPPALSIDFAPPPVDVSVPSDDTVADAATAVDQPVNTRGLWIDPSTQEERKEKKERRRAGNRIAARKFRNTHNERFAILENLVIWLRTKHPLIAVQFEEEKHLLI
jgi:hypothetical protein